MGTFGGWSQKPQLSLSNVGWAHDLFVPMDGHMRKQIERRAKDQGKEMVRKTVSKNGAKQHVTLGFEYSTLLYFFNGLEIYVVVGLLLSYRHLG